MKKRRLIVCRKITYGCVACTAHVSNEFILLVPKEQSFDGIVNFSDMPEKHTYDKYKYERKLPYKRGPIILDEIAIHGSGGFEQCCLELRLTEFGKFDTVNITACEQCLEDYDYYTISEDEYDGYSDSSDVYIAPKYISEFKRLLQVDYSVDMHIKELANSAEQGNVRAMSSLALAYLNGDGVEQNYEEAAKWFGLAAEKSLEKVSDDKYNK